MVCVNLFWNLIHYLIFQTEQNISKLDFILFCGEKAGSCTQVRPPYRILILSDNCDLSHLTTSGPCVWVVYQVGFVYVINEPSVSDSL